MSAEQVPTVGVACFSMIALLVPMLGRADRIHPLLQSIQESTSVPCRVIFLCSPGDHEVIDTLDRTGKSFVVVPWECGPGDFQRKTNYGVRITDEPWLFLGASDLEFHPGWDVEALAVATASGKRVIGMRDLGNALVEKGGHSTHSLVARSYIEEYGTIDQPGQVYSEVYGHQYCDTEMVETAMKRDEWAFSFDSIVAHQHPFWKKGQMDSTYKKGLSTSRQDLALFMQRRRLWQ